MQSATKPETVKIRNRLWKFGTSKADPDKARQGNDVSNDLEPDDSAD